MRHLVTLARVVLAAACVLVMPQTGTARADDVDLLLVLAADVSRSVDGEEFRLQRDGYAAALESEAVLQAIRSGPIGRIAVSYVEWSGPFAQAVIVDWSVIGERTEAASIAQRIREAPRPFMERTAIGAAIEFSLAHFERSAFRAKRRVIDVSGDGTNTNGRDPGSARDEAVAKGVTINGLVILSDVPLPWNPAHTHPPGGLDGYYRDNVVGGVGAFVLSAEGFETFGRSMLNKLIREIADAATPRRARFALDTVDRQTSPPSSLRLAMRLARERVVAGSPRAAAGTLDRAP